MKKVFRNTGFALLLVLSLVLSACTSNSTSTKSDNESAKSNNSSENSSNSNQKVTIEFWHTYSDTEEQVLKNDIIPLFEKDHPNITVKATRMPTDNLKQQVISAAAGNTGPDVMRMDITWVSEFAKLGALKQLDGMNGFSDVKSSQLEAAMQTNLYNGNYYGIPNDTNTKVAIYDKQLLQKAGLSTPPATFDDLVNAAKKIQDKKHSGIAVSGTATWGMLPYFWSLGGQLTNDDFTKATGYLDSQDSIAAVQQLVDLFKEGVIAPTILGGQPGTWDGIKGHQYLMIDDGPWFYSLIGDEAKTNTVAAVLPSGKGGSVSVVGGEDTVIFNNTKNPDAAWEFAKFMTTEEPQKIIAEKTGLLPTNTAAMEDPNLINDPITKAYMDQLKTAKPRIPSANYGKIDDLLNQTFEAIFRGKTTVEKGLKDAAAQLDDLLQQ